jgi:hypothetical protein
MRRLAGFIAAGAAALAATALAGADAQSARPARPDQPAGKQAKLVGDAAEAAKIYMITFTGEYGRDESITPMRRVMEDARKLQPDIIVVKVDCEFKKFGKEKRDFEPDLGSFDQMESVRQMAVLVTDDIDFGAEWAKKPRMVFWVKKALGGVAFLPFACKEIYYTSDAKHGGIGYLDLLFDGVGDEVVREKQRSLRLGRAIGISAKGGYDDHIIKAMARADYVLSVSFEGGKPIWHEDESGDILLTDDGNKEAGRRDTVEDAVRYRGNDVLTLDAEWASRLGVSRGTCNTDEELFFALGVARNHEVLPGKADSILHEWGKGVSDGELAIKRLRRELREVRVKPPAEYAERTAARGRRKAILKQMLEFLTRYEESINPDAIEANPPNLIQQIKLQIDQIDQEQRRDKR